MDNLVCYNHNHNYNCKFYLYWVCCIIRLNIELCRHLFLPSTALHPSPLPFQPSSFIFAYPPHCLVALYAITQYRVWLTAFQFHWWHHYLNYLTNICNSQTIFTVGMTMCWCMCECKKYQLNCEDWLITIWKSIAYKWCVQAHLWYWILNNISIC